MSKQTRAEEKATRVIKMTLTPRELAWVDGQRGQTSRAEWARSRMLAAVPVVSEGEGPDLGPLMPLARNYLKRATSRLGRDVETEADFREVEAPGPGTDAAVYLLRLMGFFRASPRSEVAPEPEEEWRYE